MRWKGRFESISKSCLAVSTRMQNHIISHHHKALALESAFSKIESLKILKRNVRNSTVDCMCHLIFFPSYINKSMKKNFLFFQLAICQLKGV